MSKLPLIDLYLKIMFNSFNLKQFYMPCSISLMEYFDPYFFSLLLLFDVICTNNKYLIDSLYFHITAGGSLFVSFTQFPKDLDENYNFFYPLCKLYFGASTA
ncbi:hypothetical protein CHM_5g3440 [Cryptosporidium hominis]